MILFPAKHFPQGEDDWRFLRLGRPTASEFNQILTPAKGEKSKSQFGFAARHVDERVHHGPEDVKEHYASKEMQRGTTMEPQARLKFQLEYGLFPQPVGFVLTDDERFGCSPDSFLVSAEGDTFEAGLEVKHYSPEQHMLWQQKQELPNDFKCQVHGCMVVTGLKTWYWMNNCPPYEPVIVRVDWNEFTDLLAKSLDEFDREVFQPLLAKQRENYGVRVQIDNFEREYRKLVDRAKALAA